MYSAMTSGPLPDRHTDRPVRSLILTLLRGLPCQDLWRRGRSGAGIPMSLGGTANGPPITAVTFDGSCLRLTLRHSREGDPNHTRIGGRCDRGGSRSPLSAATDRAYVGVLNV